MFVAMVSPSTSRGRTAIFSPIIKQASVSDVPLKFRIFLVFTITLINLSIFIAAQLLLCCTRKVSKQVSKRNSFSFLFHCNQHVTNAVCLASENVNISFFSFFFNANFEYR